MKKLIYIIFVLSLLMLPACSINSSSSSNEMMSKPSKTTSLPQTDKKSKAEKLLEKMTLEEKIGQLFIIRPDAMQEKLTHEQTNNLAKNSITESDIKMQQALEKYPIGGFAFFRENISTPVQLTGFIHAIQQQSSIPLFVGIDEEGGIVSRIAESPNFNVAQFESMQKIGESGDPNNAENVGLVIASYLRQYGFNLNFAPVADINTNPENIVIGSRSFGSDPALVSQMVAAEIRGFHKAGIMSCIKHFPGHGNTKGDTHDGFVSIEKTWEEVKECELIPFVDSLHASDMIMISHITAPNITLDKLPATLSAEMIEGKLRGELGYKGVIITDAMEMGAITQEYSSSESAVKAILAGIDLILMPEDFVEATNGIYTVVKKDIISEARIDKSVLRILNLKERYMLF